EWLVTDRPLAIKIFNDFEYFNPIETQILSLSIHNVVPFHGVVNFTRNQTLGIIMDLMDMNLAEYISFKGNTLSNQVKRSIIVSIARSISELHLYGISHSDIKM